MNTSKNVTINVSSKNNPSFYKRKAGQPILLDTYGYTPPELTELQLLENINKILSKIDVKALNELAKYGAKWFFENLPRDQRTLTN